MDIPVINQDYIDRVAKWKPDYDGIEAVLNSPNNTHPVFASSASGRHVINNYKKELTILTDALLYCVPNYRRGAQGIGDCVSWGAAHAVEMLIAKYAYKRRRKSIFLEVATEPIYGGCRVEALGKRNGGWSDGAFGAAAADWVNKWGIILRKDYSNETGNSSHDYTTYSSNKAKQEGYYGAGGQGDQGKIDEIAKQRPVRTISQVHSFEDCAAVIAGSKCPVTIASTAGFGNMRRDSNGFCRWSGTWHHQMCLVGVRFDIPGCLVAQSWGPRSASGPKYPNNLPDNIAGYTWWASAADIDRICRSGDCWAFSDLDGWKIERAKWDTIFGKVKT